MKEDELDNMLKGALQKDLPQVKSTAQQSSSRWIISKEVIVRWSIIGAFTLAALAIVYATGGAESFSGRLVEIVAEVQDWLKAY